MATKSKSGGGPASKQVKQVGVKTGGSNRAIKPSYASQLGQQVAKGQAIVKPDGGKALPSQLGNSVALNVNGGGPGKGREIIGKSGSQNCYGNGGPARPEGRDIFADFPGKGD